ncbi:MAG: cytochrome c3 family protein [Acidobacteriia bacterium]|nr:cytochrome c3 family protein [Terriglobia bacterium]
MRIVILSLWAACIVCAQTGLKSPAAPVEQPLPFSHKKHSELGLTCKTCHKNADPGESMGIAAVSSCMGCHKTAAAESPAIKRLARHAEMKSDPVWARVYLIPSYVFFSHRRHLESGATCQTCHGPVAAQDQLRREIDISMGGCMECHVKNRARNDCNYCHEPR